MLVCEQVMLFVKTPISGDDMQRLNGLGWFTENIINAFLQLLQHEVDDDSTTSCSLPI